MHPSELARVQRELSYDPTKLQPVVPPGSLTEDEALAAIDYAREVEVAKLGDTPQARAQRARRAWAAKGRRGI